MQGGQGRPAPSRKTLGVFTFLTKNIQKSVTEEVSPTDVLEAG